MNIKTIRNSYIIGILIGLWEGIILLWSEKNYDNYLYLLGGAVSGLIINVVFYTSIVIVFTYLLNRLISNKKNSIIISNSFIFFGYITLSLFLWVRSQFFLGLRFFDPKKLLLYLGLFVIPLIGTLLIKWCAKKFERFFYLRKKILRYSLFTLCVVILIFWLFPLISNLFISDRGSFKTPGIIIISIDTQRADYSGAYNTEVDYTPNITEFAEDSYIFDYAYCPMPTTGPSHTSLFTGLQPFSSGVLINGVSHSENIITLTEILKENGYHTLASVSGLPLARDYTGIDNGFDIYDDFFNPFYYLKKNVLIQLLNIFKEIFSFERNAGSTVDSLIRNIERSSEENPIFAFLHFFEPHHPYTPPLMKGNTTENADLFRNGMSISTQWTETELSENSSEIENQIRTLYKGEVSYVDEEIGRFFEFLRDNGIFEKSIIAVVSDHGEGLGDHNRKFHGDGLYDEQSKVVMLLYIPEKIREQLILPEPYRVVNGVVEMVDLSPTIADLIGIDYDCEGTSLVPLIKQKLLPEHTDAFMQDCRGAFGLPQTVDVYPKIFALRKNDLKLIWDSETGDVELYNLISDPFEKFNLSEENHDDVKELIILLQERIDESNDRIEMSLSQEEYENLKSLGYIH